MSKSVLSVGTIVHYVHLDGGHRAAIVVDVLDADAKIVSLAEFGGTANEHGGGPRWVGSVPFSDEPQPQTWHWIER